MMSPAVQVSVCRDLEQCLFSNYPTCAELRAAYGESAPAMWLLPHLVDLSEYCGCKDKMNSRQLEQCAEIIASEFFHLKVSELMLFFMRFKSSRYGRFYGAVDPLVITEALRQFMKERAAAIDEHERELARQRREAWQNSKTTMTWEEYQEWKKTHEISG